jgi:hypothetical protein
MGFLASTITIWAFAQIQPITNDKITNQIKIDTAYILRRTDSLATTILKTYDENSLRQTGVPLTIEHFDKISYFQQEQNNALVSYCLNKTKFYGPKSEGIIIKDIDKYPFYFEIVFDLKTNKTEQRKLVDNK